MPGIVGIISNKPRALATEELRRMMASMRHESFYVSGTWIDEELGLVYLRVLTWAPFRLQFYCNGHGCLARRLTPPGIGFTPADNAFVRIDD